MYKSSGSCGFSGRRLPPDCAGATKTNRVYPRNGKRKDKTIKSRREKLVRRHRGLLAASKKTRIIKDAWRCFYAIPFDESSANRIVGARTEKWQMEKVCEEVSLNEHRL